MQRWENAGGSTLWVPKLLENCKVATYTHWADIQCSICIPMPANLIKWHGVWLHAILGEGISMSSCNVLSVDCWRTMLWRGHASKFYSVDRVRVWTRRLLKFIQVQLVVTTLLQWVCFVVHVAPFNTTWSVRICLAKCSSITARGYASILYPRASKLLHDSYIPVVMDVRLKDTVMLDLCFHSELETCSSVGRYEENQAAREGGKEKVRVSEREREREIGLYMTSSHWRLFETKKGKETHSIYPVLMVPWVVID